MRIIGVLDLLGGRAVHARAGMRERYAPVTHAAGFEIRDGSALDLASIYVEHLGVRELYVADLDHILGGLAQDGLIRRLASLGVPLWLDAAVRSAEAATHAFALGATQVVVGLETLPSFALLDTVCATAGGDRVAFSLDLRAGVPIVLAGGAIAGSESAEALAARAADAGAGTLIAIDLARVGTGVGFDIGLLNRVRTAVPGTPLIAGGGIRSADELRQLGEAGCDGALIATALQDGRITAAGVRAAARGM